MLYRRTGTGIVVRYGVRVELYRIYELKYRYRTSTVQVPVQGTLPDCNLQIVLTVRVPVRTVLVPKVHLLIKGVAYDRALLRYKY